MEFSDSYFEEEVRDGFYISSKMKCCWAAQLEVLLVVDEICRKHNIQYFAEWGTLLGCIRHGGFIPWDDDMDISMKRMDYEKFQKIVEAELPEGYTILWYGNDENYWDVMMRVINSDFVNFSPEFLDEFHNCPYPAGIDIFPLDYVTNNKEEEEIQKELVELVKTVADSNGQGYLKEQDLEGLLALIENVCGQKIERDGNIKNQLYKLLTALYALYGEEDGDRIALIPQYLDWGGSVYPKECYADSVQMPFDVVTMPVPMGYDEILTRKYGDYMRNVRSGGGHNYPYFDAHDKFLKENGAEIPIYQYPDGLSERVKAPDFKQSLLQKLQLLSQIHEKLELLIKSGNRELVQKLFEELQNVAVVIGNSIEKKLGEGTEIVSLLEQYCEGVFELYGVVSQNMAVDGREVRAILDDALQMIIEKAKNLSAKREIVFMPYHASQWKAIESVWRKACEDEDNIVRVVPIPYYYKRQMGAALSERHYEGDQFPEYVPITDFMEYDVENNHPDRIYIQNPHDNWDYVLTVHSDYYSDRLWKNTEQLIYIPWFKTDEITKQDERAINAMRYYVAMPGVVNADQVIVQSEAMKQSYVDYLSQWAGEETRPIWKEKISGAGSPLDDAEDQGEQRPEEWKGKRVLLYYISGNGLLEHGEEMLAKMQDSMNIFEEQADKLQIIWLQDLELRQRLQKRAPQLLKEYEQAVLDADQKAWITIMGDSDKERAVKMSDAFYGDGGKSAQLMMAAKKPVMLQNVEIR